jgi:hypothetical protein
LKGGKKTSTTRLLEASAKDFPASLFELPAGYTKKTMPGLE